MCKHKIRFDALNIRILQLQQVQEMLSKILLPLDIIIDYITQKQSMITKQRKEQKTKSK